MNIYLAILVLVGAAVTAAMNHYGYFKQYQEEETPDINYIPQPPKPPVVPQEASSTPQAPFYIPTNPKTTMTNREKLYQTALASLHKDMSPLDKAPNTLACMESVDGVYLTCFGEHLLSPATRLSTELGYQAMIIDRRLEKVTSPLPGDIVICPTGYSSIGSQHGHTGIWGNFDVMSNDSNTGLWTDNYTQTAWDTVFHKTLGFPVYYFRVIG